MIKGCNNFYNKEAEQIVIGNLILYNESWNEIHTFLNLESFFFENHKILFSIILEFLNLNSNFDIFSIINILNLKKRNFDFINYLNFLIQKLPNPSNIFFYASIIHNTFILRKILFIINRFSQKIINLNKFNLIHFLENIELDIFNINKIYNKNNSIFLISDILKKCLEDNNLNLKDVFLTGFEDIDKILSGIKRGDLIILAGRPSTGKTAFSLNIIKYISEYYKIPSIIFSMEMSINQLFIRLLCLIFNEEQNIIINSLNSNYLEINFEYIKSLKIFIDDTSNLSILNIYSKCKYILKEYGNLGLVVIDYLQLISSLNLNNNRVFEISEISRSLKCLAKELNVPIVAISQLNRNSELRNDKKPVISDLRESGSIEQDADIILFMHKDSILENSDMNNVEVIIGKHRNGPIGKVILNFNSKKSKFFK